MLLLLNQGLPKSADELRDRLSSGLNQYFHLPHPDSTVALEGELSQLQQLRINLSGARLDPGQSAPIPGGQSQQEGQVMAQRLEVKADPIHLGDAAEFRLVLEANQAVFVLLSDAHQKWWLALQSVGQGKVLVEVGDGQLEHLFLEGVAHALKRHGFTLDEGSVSLHKVDDRTVKLQMAIRARKGIIKGGVDVEGQLMVDEKLNIHLSGFLAKGHGLLGKLAAPFISPVMERFQTQPIPLLGHAFGELNCHHLRIDLEGRDALMIEASIGSAG